MTDVSKNKPKLTSFDLFLDVNMPHIDHCIEQLRKEIGLRQKSQIKALKLLLCNLYIQQDKEIMLSRKKQSLGTSKYNPLGIGYRGIILCGVIGSGKSQLVITFLLLVKPEASIFLLDPSKEI